MTTRDDLTDDELVDLEELREILLPRCGMMSSIAAAYADCDVDMMRAFESVMTDESPISATEVSRGVRRLRRLHDRHDVSHLITGDHIYLERDTYVLLQRASISKGAGVTYEEDPTHTDKVIDFAYLNVRRGPQLLSVISSGCTDLEEITAAMETMADQSLALVEGTL